MRVRIVSIGDIDDAMVSRWNAWASPGGRLVSPYLRFEFTQCIARVRDDVRIAVFEDAGQIIGFFPHHAAREGVIRPIGAPMSDYQGIIAAPGQSFDLRAVLGSAGGSALVFDNWYGPLSDHAAPMRDIDGSTIVDLAGGADAYFAARKAESPSHFRKTARLHRNAERDHGPVRIQMGDPDGRLFETLSNWKQTQYRATGKLDVFAIDWVQAALSDLRQAEGSEFGGMTAALWFGDRLAAVEFGLVAGEVYHSWFPAYDPELAKYSPGLLLMQGIFRQAGERGIERVDLGAGSAHYKKYYRSYDVPLGQGRVLGRGLAALGIRSWEMTESAARIMPGKLGEIPARLRRRWAQASAFESGLPPRLASMARALTL
ncbi:GNAT family N-acetyltransferase [Maricaulis sp.]|uniref:GNAT family N-acetyltransferase n=1 Tax=Maricaulis sp. TaxID=1486257 RepID=UPI003A953080